MQDHKSKEECKNKYEPVEARKVAKFRHTGPLIRRKFGRIIFEFKTYPKNRNCDPNRYLDMDQNNDKDQNGEVPYQYIADESYVMFASGLYPLLEKDWNKAENQDVGFNEKLDHDKTTKAEPETEYLGTNPFADSESSHQPTGEACEAKPKSKPKGSVKRVKPKKGERKAKQKRKLNKAAMDRKIEKEGWTFKYFERKFVFLMKKKTNLMWFIEHTVWKKTFMRRAFGKLIERDQLLRQFDYVELYRIVVIVMQWQQEKLAEETGKANGFLSKSQLELLLGGTGEGMQRLYELLCKLLEEDDTHCAQEHMFMMQYFFEDLFSKFSRRRPRLKSASSRQPVPRKIQLSRVKFAIFRKHISLIYSSIQKLLDRSNRDDFGFEDKIKLKDMSKGIHNPQICCFEDEFEDLEKCLGKRKSK